MGIDHVPCGPEHLHWHPGSDAGGWTISKAGPREVPRPPLFSLCACLRGEVGGGSTFGEGFPGRVTASLLAATSGFHS